ncbi:hypothetical protein F5I97DRAFT_1930589 [Phlebopus sp. FC_14]|nr:hypothetical protein F5I97DRAFT_1930589 [Phlebopus sp. FC_14]
MAAAEAQGLSHCAQGKGKARLPVQATETTPLLSVEGSSRSSPDDELDPESSIVARRQLCSKLALVFISSLIFCFVVFLIFAFLAYSYAARLSSVSPRDLLENGLVVEGPDSVGVLNATDGGLWINVKARVGIDAGSILGVNTDDDEGTLTDLSKSLGRLGVRLVQTITLNLSAVHVYSTTHAPLCTVASSPLELPVTTNPPYDASWLTAVSVPLFVKPTNDSTDVALFIRDAWRTGAVSVSASISRAVVWGGAPEASGWRSKLKFEFEDIETHISLPLPPIPGLPTPGEDTPLPSFSEVVSLQAFDIASTPERVTLHALATFVNPAPPTFQLTVPTMPFTVSLPSSQHTHIPVASVDTQPFLLTHPNVTLFISGTVLPLPREATEALSMFATRYLSLQRNPIYIFSPLFPSLVIDTDFPSPNPKPQLLRNVTIRNMKIKPASAGSGFLASGEVFARLVLPKGMNFMMDVKRVFPDVLIFDGEVPDISTLLTTCGNVHHVTNPLPDGAFGRIQPDDWLDATSVYDGSDDGGSTFSVTSWIVDVAVEVLPGRQKEFSNFVSKVIFNSDGALAGLQGTVDVGVSIVGLPVDGGTGKDSGFELKGLPFKGNVRVGKKGFVVSHS